MREWMNDEFKGFFWRQLSYPNQALSPHYLNGLRTTTKNLIRPVGFPAEIRNRNLPNIGTGIYSYMHLLGSYISSQIVVRIFSNISKLDFFIRCKVIALYNQSEKKWMRWEFELQWNFGLFIRCTTSGSHNFCKRRKVCIGSSCIFCF
jgi:hypothetical protein